MIIGGKYHTLNDAVRAWSVQLTKGFCMYEKYEHAIHCIEKNGGYLEPPHTQRRYLRRLPPAPVTAEALAAALGNGAWQVSQQNDTTIRVDTNYALLGGRPVVVTAVTVGEETVISDGGRTLETKRGKTLSHPCVMRLT